MNELHKKLFNLRDDSYKKFLSKLLPNVDEKIIIGVRTPQLREFIKKYFTVENIPPFLNSLPHKYHEENLIHSFLISDIKNFSNCINEIEKFLPFVDNWATCDALIPKIFKSHTQELEAKIFKWLDSDSEYTIRFALLMLMKFYLDENFKEDYLQLAAKIQTEKYYAQMMAALYFAEALAKHYESAVIYFEDKKISAQIHNKAIQKAVESRRISVERKNYLRTLRR